MTRRLFSSLPIAAVAAIPPSTGIRPRVAVALTVQGLSEVDTEDLIAHLAGYLSHRAPSVVTQALNHNIETTFSEGGDVKTHTYDYRYSGEYQKGDVTLPYPG